MVKKLPIGIQTFQNLIEEGYAYVDKTRFVAGIADQNKYYFLSRPRRFGKSLLLSTLRSAFEGRQELFQGLFCTTIGTGRGRIPWCISASGPG
jgi:hypothetical protein